MPKFTTQVANLDEIIEVILEDQNTLNEILRDINRSKIDIGNLKNVTRDQQYAIHKLIIDKNLQSVIGALSQLIFSQNQASTKDDADKLAILSLIYVWQGTIGELTDIAAKKKLNLHNKAIEIVKAATKDNDTKDNDIKDITISEIKALEASGKLTEAEIHDLAIIEYNNINIAGQNYILEQFKYGSLTDNNRSITISDGKIHYINDIGQKYQADSSSCVWKLGTVSYKLDLAGNLECDINIDYRAFVNHNLVDRTELFISDIIHTKYSQDDTMKLVVVPSNIKSDQIKLLLALEKLINDEQFYSYYPTIIKTQVFGDESEFDPNHYLSSTIQDKLGGRDIKPLIALCKKIGPERVLSHSLEQIKSLIAINDEQFESLIALEKLINDDHFESIYSLLPQRFFRNTNSVEYRDLLSSENQEKLGNKALAPLVAFCEKHHQEICQTDDLLQTTKNCYHRNLFYRFYFYYLDRFWNFICCLFGRANRLEAEVRQSIE